MNEQTEERNYETEASAMGWVPKEEFKGDPDKWGTAQEFVEAGEKKIPLLVANTRKLTEQVNTLQQSLEYQANHHTKALQEQADRLRADHESKMDAAVVEGDTDAYNAAKKERDAVKDPVTPVVPQGPSDIEVQFAAENTWYNSDSVMTQVANAESQRLAKSGVTGAANLEGVKKHVMDNFPHKFSNPNRDEPGAVSAGKRPSKTNGKSFSSLPDDAKEAFAKFHRNGVFGKDAKLADAQKQYVSTYQWDE